MSRVVATVLTSLNIDEVERAGETYFESAFSLLERKYLASRHVRSTAGWLALKKAVIQLLGDKKKCVLSKRDITLKCLPDGRPVIADIAFAEELSVNLFVSISHTRTTAHGLAVLQED